MTLPPRHHPAAHGFTLIEVMVGLVLALLAIIVVSRVLLVAEGNKRVATSGSDAQINGALALFALQREIEQAGYGIAVNPAALGCTVNYNNGATGSVTGSFILAPVVITQGAGGLPDTITVLRSSKTGAAVPLAIASNHALTDSSFTVTSAYGVAAGDLMIAVPSAWNNNATYPSTCTLFSVAASATYALSTTTVPHVAGTAAWNPATPILPAAGYAAGDTLLDMGALVQHTYNIVNNRLTYAQFGVAGTPTITYDQIVNLQALYAEDTNGDGVIDTYTDVTPATAADWAKVRGIRVAVVARSANYEKDVVTTVMPTWDLGQYAAGTTKVAVIITGTNNASVACNSSAAGDTCLRLPVDINNTAIAGNGTDWQHYRYRVFDTLIPLRNVLWNS